MDFDGNESEGVDDIGGTGGQVVYHRFVNGEKVGDRCDGGIVAVCSEPMASEDVEGRVGAGHQVSAVCEVRRRSMPVTKAGKLHVHGPLSNHCEGSGMLRSSLLHHSPLHSQQLSHISQQFSPRVLRSQPHLSSHSPASPAVVLSHVSSSSCDPPGSPNSDRSSILSNFCQPFRVLKRIPRASRHLAATKLTAIINDVVEKNEDRFWDRLFKFCHRCFAVPRWGREAA